MFSGDKATSASVGKASEKGAQAESFERTIYMGSEMKKSGLARHSYTRECRTAQKTTENYDSDGEGRD